MIISVGYRVNSKRGTQFHIWATHVLLAENRPAEKDILVQVVANLINKKNI